MKPLYIIFSKLNGLYNQKLYSSSKASTYIMYLDVNNIYEQSMIQLLSIEILDWVNLDDYSDNGSKLYFLEVNLDYPDELHDFNNYYILSSKKQSEKMSSEYKL